MRVQRFIVLFCAAAVAIADLHAVEVKPNGRLPVVRVNSTNQPYDFFRPWNKKTPYSRRGLGAVLTGNRILVTAETIADSSFVELERAETGAKEPARVEVVDYEANLALLKPLDEKFLSGITPLELEHAKVGDRADVWQLETTGDLLSTSGLVTAVAVTRYPVDAPFLAYRMTSSLQYREGSFTLPVVKDGKLIGLLMRYDTRTQNVDVIPAPVIAHFLQAAAREEYHGFPRAGIEFASMRDPQLRRYAGLGSDAAGGVYITQIEKKSPAAEAGIAQGDVLLGIGGKSIDQDGNYTDKRYGKISLSNLISTEHFHGDQIPFTLSRRGEKREVMVKLAHRPARKYVSALYVVDEAPQYLVLGGLVFQELSRQYLKEWGDDWKKTAPQKLVYYDQNQSDLFENGKVIILSQVLPSSHTVGYENLGYLVVTSVNGQAIKNMQDLARAVEKPVEGFHRVEFEDHPREIYLDAEQVLSDRDALLESYRLPAIKRLHQ